MVKPSNTRKTGRNDPCPCGSGRKYKFCHLNSKQRQIFITLDMGKPVEANGFIIDPKKGIYLTKNGHELIPQKTDVSIGYERTKGTKILNSISVPPGFILKNTAQPFMFFDLFFAIDTNSQFKGSNKISVCCIVLCRINWLTKKASYRPVKCIEFWNIKAEEEKVAYCEAIRLMMNNPSFNRIGKIGLIIDAYMNEIADLNSRLKPIYDDMFLPKKLEFVYASSDAGKEYLPNKLISLCDKESKCLLHYVIDNEISNPPLIKVHDENYSHVRYWDRQET